MSTEYGTPRDGIEALVGRIQRCEQAQAEQSRSPSMRSASIVDGALTIKDAASNPMLRIGKMSVGGYGIEALDPTTAQWYPLSAIASAQQASSSAVASTFSVTEGVASGWIATGPNVQVTTYTGRLTVQVGAKLDLYGNKATLACSYDISGPAYIGPDVGRGVAVTYDTVGMGVNLQAGYPYVHIVPPGTYTVRTMCQQFSGAGEASDGTVENKTLIVRPD